MIATRAASAALLGCLALAAAGCFPRIESRTPPVVEAAAAPDFALPDHLGREVTLGSLVAEGAAVIVFYRGYW